MLLRGLDSVHSILWTKENSTAERHRGQGHPAEDRPVPRRTGPGAGSWHRAKPPGRSTCSVRNKMETSSIDRTNHLDRRRRRVCTSGRCARIAPSRLGLTHVGSYTHTRRVPIPHRWDKPELPAGLGQPSRTARCDPLQSFSRTRHSTGPTVGL